MDVFLVPLGADRYELYCEVPDGEGESTSPEGEPPGLLRRLSEAFHGMLTAAERARHQVVPRQGWWPRLRHRLLRWVTERVAEQRLLWHLRRHDAATLVYPADIGEDAASAQMRAVLERDVDRHRRGLVISGIGLVVSGAFAILPGPNLIAYYFAFLVVGHYLSSRGARHGLDRVAWDARPSGDLAELRRLAGLESPDRERRVHDVAARLRLQHLAAFVERIVPRSA